MSENNSLRRKIEKGISSYLENHADLSNLTVYRGSEPNEPVLPMLIVAVQSTQNDSSMPHSAGVRIASASIQYHASAHDSLRDDVDDIVGCLEYVMSDIEAIQLAVNKQNVNDTRNVLGVHIYDVYLDSDPIDQVEETWQHLLELSIKCGEHEGVV